MSSSGVPLFSAFLTCLQVDSLVACCLIPWTISFCLLFHRNQGPSILPPAALVAVLAGPACLACFPGVCIHQSS